MLVKPEFLVITAGKEEAISFTDEGSPDTHLTGNDKVCVDAQVDRSLSLDWYYKIIRWFPDAPGELKSSVVVARLKNFPSEVRSAIWTGLRRVKIHIVDPRCHRRRFENMLRETWRSKDAPQTLDRMAREGLPHARFISEQLRDMVADSILHDSTAMRVQSLGRALADPFLGSVRASDLPPCMVEPEVPSKPLVAVSDFKKRKGLIRDVTSWSAKSSAAFHSALDAGSEAFDGEDATAYYANFENVVQRRMAQELLSVHAFDEGNQRHLDLLDDARQSVIKELAARDYHHGLIIPQPGFVATESRESYYVQAADIAAGMASDLYAHEGLIGIVDRWEYVTYNGARVSRTDAEEEMRKLRSFDV
jgi:hypothetical protein